MKNVLLIVLLLVFSINLVKAQGLGSENKSTYLESIKLIDKNKGTMSSGVNTSLPISEQNSTPYLDLYNSLDSIGKKELIQKLQQRAKSDGIGMDNFQKFSDEIATIDFNVSEEEKREVALLFEEEWKKKEEKDALLKVQTNKLNVSSKVMEDVSFWDTYGKSFVETLLILISIMIGFALLKLLIKGVKKLRKIKVKDISKHPKTINLKEKIMNYFKTMNSKDIIIFSIILGVLVALCLGYSFGNTKYLVRKGLVVSEEVYKEREFSTYLNKYFNFNYILGTASFIITTGVSYLYLSKKR